MNRPPVLKIVPTDEHAASQDGHRSASVAAWQTSPGRALAGLEWLARFRLRPGATYLLMSCFLMANVAVLLSPFGLRPFYDGVQVDTQASALFFIAVIGAAVLIVLAIALFPLPSGAVDQGRVSAAKARRTGGDAGADTGGEKSLSWRRQLVVSSDFPFSHILVVTHFAIHEMAFLGSFLFWLVLFLISSAGHGASRRLA